MGRHFRRGFGVCSAPFPCTSYRALPRPDLWHRRGLDHVAGAAWFGRRLAACSLGQEILLPASILLETFGMSRGFAGLRAVSDGDLKVHGGETVGGSGANGGGKSTTFNMLAGALPPSAGAIHFEGRRMDGLPSHRVAAL